MVARDLAVRLFNAALRSPYTSVIGAAVLAVVAVALWAGVGAGASASAGEIREIQNVMRRARQAEIGLAVVPKAYQSSQLPQNVADQMKRRVDRVCRMYYVGRVLRQCLVIEKLQIDEDVGGRFLVLEGKITAIKYSDINVAGRRATGSALITEAIATAQRKHGRLYVFPSHNTMRMTYRLVKKGGAWKVRFWDVAFLPGSGP